jgi:hypothetical protein
MAGSLSFIAGDYDSLFHTHLIIYQERVEIVTG